MTSLRQIVCSTALALTTCNTSLFIDFSLNTTSTLARPPLNDKNWREIANQAKKCHRVIIESHRPRVPSEFPEMNPVHRYWRNAPGGWAIRLSGSNDMYSAADLETAKKIFNSCDDITAVMFFENFSVYRIMNGKVQRFDHLNPNEWD